MVSHFFEGETVLKLNFLDRKGSRIASVKFVAKECLPMHIPTLGAHIRVFTTQLA